MPIIEVDGQELEFPDDMQPDAIKAVLQAKFPKPEPRFMGRVGADIEKRGEQSRAAQADYEAGKQGLVRTRFQQLGLAGAGTISDVVGEGLKSLYDAGVGPKTKKIISGAGQVAGDAASNNQMGVALKEAATQAGEFAQANPAIARDVGAAFNLASMVPISKAASQVIPPAASMAKKGLSSGASAAKAAFREKKINSIIPTILPKETPSQIADTITQRTLSGGLGNKVVYNPSASEKFMAEVALDVGIKPKAPIVKNVQVANFSLRKEAQNLKSTLDKANATVAPNMLNKKSVEIAERIAANPLVDENTMLVEKILSAAQNAIDSNPKTAAGLLQARKDFDEAITQFQPTALDVTAPATAFRHSAKQVRSGLNELVAETVPDALVKESLRKQSALYEIIENLASKAGEQGKIGKGRISRFLETPAGKVAKYGAVAGGGIAVGNQVVGGIAAGTQ